MLPRKKSRTLALVAGPILLGSSVVDTISIKTDRAYQDAYESGELTSMEGERRTLASNAPASRTDLKRSLDSASTTARRGVRMVSADTSSGGNASSLRELTQALSGSSRSATSQRVSRKRQQAPTATRLTVFTEPSDARVRIMNIGPKYRDGIRLDYGRYDIEVSKPGYRTQRFPISVDSRQTALNVDLAKRDGFPCRIDHIYKGGHPLTDYGTQLRVELSLPDTSLYEVYSSLATYLDEQNYIRDVTTEMGNHYAYISGYQPRVLTKEDIAQNREANMSDGRLKLHYGLEDGPNDTVTYTQYVRIPKGTGFKLDEVETSVCQAISEL